MKAMEFPQANSREGKLFISNINNSAIMVFKPSFVEKIKILIGTPIWVGAPIQSDSGSFSIKVTKVGIFKEEEDKTQQQRT